MRLTATRRNEMLDSIRDNLANCKIRIYSGTRPANADTALSGNTLLAELTGNATFAPAASGGVLTANAITGDTSADNGGAASFARVFESDGTTVIGDLSVTATGGGGEIEFATTTFVQGVAVGLTSLTITLPIGS